MNNRIMLCGDQYQVGNMLPTCAVYEDSDGAKEFSMLTHHLMNGDIFLTGDITTNTSLDFASCMLMLSKERLDARIFICSDGGEVNAGLMMYDIIQSFKGSIEMFCIGRAASMAAVLLAGGQKGKRFILPHSKVMIHEPLIAGGLGGSASSIEKTAQNILEVRDITNGIIAGHTGHTLAEVNKATRFDNVMTAEEAVRFGICDEIRNIF